MLWVLGLGHQAWPQAPVPLKYGSLFKRKGDLSRSRWCVSLVTALEWVRQEESKVNTYLGCMYGKTISQNKTKREKEKGREGKDKEKKEKKVRPVLSDLKDVHDIFQYRSTIS